MSRTEAINGRRTGLKIISGSMVAVMGGLIRAYQVLISPYLPSACRFYPSCSQYAREALEKHGPFKGTSLSVRRIMRCHPFHPGGVDPVP